MSTPTPGAAPQMAAEHTTRQWRYAEKRGFPHESAHPHCVMGPPHPVDGGDYAPLACFRDKRDALLAVAAPDLLAALEANMNWIGAPPTGPHEYDSAREAAWEMGRAALAKAKAGAK